MTTKTFGMTLALALLTTTALVAATPTAAAVNPCGQLNVHAIIDCAADTSHDTVDYANYMIDWVQDRIL